MKFLTAIAMTVMVSSAAAYTQADIPACAKPCADDAAKQVGCAADDVKCICSKKDDVRTAATSCVLDNCSSEDAIKAAKVASDICKNQ
ncbi:putative extracellular membrane-like protein [Lasiodiplodia theobromae]|uniref:CFEM domain-containing protein n=2 Tax=Lasiodiplodia TaxID=66739 RepID=A0A5N5CU56_9PEZI|nr:Extracellular membrane protein [Lasiodiplodia theobromae]KAB2568890.1 hypothetical protein DBV05_g12429 [Lasiodiplodia theobromae]KAF4543498.1 Extracellular membrane protein [Lasiodiplodia theobromae]KAF9631230.1 putative extracellular membrane-like protein [Lasiodiplodia theobromae]KAK0622246.1 hypothetical protein DIS24_g11262 [Lasiodiplodia hormozganensis]